MVFDRSFHSGAAKEVYGRTSDAKLVLIVLHNRMMGFLRVYVMYRSSSLAFTCQVVLPLEIRRPTRNTPRDSLHAWAPVLNHYSLEVQYCR